MNKITAPSLEYAASASERMEWNHDAIPELAREIDRMAEENGLEWKKCGGQKVGDYTQPTVWRLRDKYSSDIMNARTKEMQRLTGAIRYLHETLPYLPDDLKSFVVRFLSA